jgi:thiol peroxidase
MATVTLRGNAIPTSGDLPGAGTKAPDFDLVAQDLSSARLATYKGRKKVLNIFPSVDTPTCAASVRAFNAKAAEHKDTVVLNVSGDLPFAMKRFCGAEGLKDVHSLSTFRDGGAFGRAYGVLMTGGPLTGLLARSVLVLDEQDKVLYGQLVPELANEPDYAKALGALKVPARK